MSSVSSVQSVPPRRSRALAKPALSVAIFFAVLAAVFVPTGAASATVFDNVAVGGWYVNGAVHAVDLSGDVVYFGGKFTSARNPAGGGIQRGNVAAISRTTGDLIQAFDVETDGIVYAIESDGDRVWIGGEFTTVNGQYHPYLVAVDAHTGEIDPTFTAAPNKGVRAIDHAGGRLWVSGSFFKMNGSRMARVASLDPITGQPDYNFVPESDSIVRTVELSNDGSYLVVGGGFQNVGGEARRALAKLDPATGNALPSTFPTNLSPVLGVATNDDDSRIFVAFGGSTGGALFGWNNRVASFDAVTSENNWYRRADGDVQAIGFHDGWVYFGHHDPFEGDPTVRMLRISPDGVIDNGWRPALDTRRGVLAIDVNSDGLAAGGTFKNVNGFFKRSIAVWASGPGAVTANPDTVAPTTPTGLVVTRNNGNVVKMEWNADSTDDRFMAGYRTYRNGVLLDESLDGAHNDWKPLNGGDSTYEIRAVDASGNESVAATVVVTVP